MLIVTLTSGTKTRISPNKIVLYKEWPTKEGVFTHISFESEVIVIKETVEQLDKALRSAYFEIKEVL